MPMIQMTAIASRDLTDAPAKLIKQTRDRAKKALKIWAKIFKVEYLKTHANWPRQPVWHIKYESTTEGESVTIYTNNNIYRFLHDGTKVRWAVMSNPFTPKTSYRLLGSGPGKGKAILKGAKAMGKAGIQAPMPGIEARRWTDEILRVHENRFQDSMNKVVFGDFDSS